MLRVCSFFPIFGSIDGVYGPLVLSAVNSFCRAENRGARASRDGEDEIERKGEETDSEEPTRRNTEEEREVTLPRQPATLSPLSPLSPPLLSLFIVRLYVHPFNYMFHYLFDSLLILSLSWLRLGTVERLPLFGSWSTDMIALFICPPSPFRFLSSPSPFSFSFSIFFSPFFPTLS